MTMPAANPTLRDDIVAFYAYETALLDDFRLHEWLELLADDVRYLMPMLETRQGPALEDAAGGPQFYLFNEDKTSLSTRVARLDTGLALVESPRSATQRLVTDVLLLGAEDDFVDVRSSFLVYQVRDERNDATFVGHRVDRLRRNAGSFLILKRDITLAHYVLPRTISIFF